MRALTIGLIIAAMLILMSGCRFMAASGRATSALGEDIEALAEGYMSQE